MVEKSAMAKIGSLSNSARTATQAICTLTRLLPSASCDVKFSCLQSFRFDRTRLHRVVYSITIPPVSATAKPVRFAVTDT